MPLLAYIDPGSGSMLIQVLVAGVLAVPFFFRRAIGGGWRRMRRDGSNHATTRDEDSTPKP
jgi:hypothetical protein